MKFSYNQDRSTKVIRFYSLLRWWEVSESVHEWRFSRRGLNIRFYNFSKIAPARAFSESKCFGTGFSVELPLARSHLKTYIFSSFFCRFSFFYVFYTKHHERRTFMLFINCKKSISCPTNKYRGWPIFHNWAYSFKREENLFSTFAQQVAFVLSFEWHQDVNYRLKN